MIPGAVSFQMDQEQVKPWKLDGCLRPYATINAMLTLEPRTHLFFNTLPAIKRSTISSKKRLIKWWSPSDYQSNEYE